MARKTEKEMFSWMKRYEEGKVGRKEVCSATGVKGGSFQYWWKRYRDALSGSNGTMKFMPVKLVQEDESKPRMGMEVILKNGLVLRFEELVPVGYLSELMQLV